MGQLVRQHAALLLGAERRERQLGHADLGEPRATGLEMVRAIVW